MSRNVAVYCGWCKSAIPALTQDIEPKTMLAVLYRHIFNCDHYAAAGGPFIRNGDEGDDGSLFWNCKPDPNGVYGTTVQL